MRGIGGWRRWREEKEASTYSLAGAVVHLHSFVLLALFVFLLLFLLHFFDLQLLQADLSFLFFIWTE